VQAGDQLQDVVGGSQLQSTHLKTDLINIGHYKNLNTIGKQDYQEPGVEAELNFEFFESFHFIF